MFPPIAPAAPVVRLRSCRAEAVLIVLYVVGALGAGFLGFKLLKWDPFKDGRVTAAAKKFEDAEARYQAATQAVQAERAAARQQATEVDADAKRQTQAAQSMVAATGQALATAPPEVRGDLHVSAALQTNAVAAHALESALGPLSPAQLAEVNRLVASATAASEAQRAQADAQLADLTQQLAAAQADQHHHQQLLREADAKLADAQNAAADAQTTVEQTARQLRRTADHRDGLGHLLDRLFLGLKLGLGLYLVLAYGLPLASHFLPGLHPLSDLAHALLNPFMHQEKTGAEALARDASAATDELLELIAQRAPELLKEAHARAGAWLTEHDGVRARFEQMLKLVHRR